MTGYVWTESQEQRGSQLSVKGPRPRGTQGPAGGAGEALIANRSANVIGIFYKDTSNSQIKYFGQLSTNVSGVEILRINYGNTKDTNLVLRTGLTNGVAAQTVNLSLAAVPDTSSDIPANYDNVTMAWGTVSGTNLQLDSLGNTRSTEEAGEILKKLQG